MDKRRKTTLKSTQKFMDLIFENVPDLIFVKDKDHIIIKANEHFLDLYPPEKRDKIIGYTTVEDYPEDEVKAFYEEDKKAFDLGYAKTIENIQFPDGKRRTLLTRKIRFYDEDNKPYILCIATDITDQEILQNETEESQNMLHAVLDTLPGMIFVKDKKSKILYANQTVLDKYPPEMKGKVIGHTTYDFYPENIRDTLYKHDQKALSHGDITEIRDFGFPNGELMQLNVRKTKFTVNGEDHILCHMTEID